MTIIIRRPWTQQPQTPVPVEKANPLSVGLTGLWSFNLGPRNLVTGELGSISGGVLQPTQRGVALAHTATTNYAVLTSDFRKLFSSSEGTVAIWCKKRDTTFRTARLLSANISDNTVIVQTYSDTKLYWNWPTAFNDNVAGTFTGENTFVSVIGGGTGIMYHNGSAIKSKSGTANITGGAGAPLYIGDDSTVDTSELVDYYQIATWSRALTAMEVKSWHSNPWQLFAPHQIIIPTSTVAATAPTLSALSAINVTATSAQPRITYTF